jgi:hypothetical protein
VDRECDDTSGGGLARSGFFHIRVPHGWISD